MAKDAPALIVLASDTCDLPTAGLESGIGLRTDAVEGARNWPAKELRMDRVRLLSISLGGRAP